MLGLLGHFCRKIPTRGWSEKQATRNAEAGWRERSEEGEEAERSLNVSAAEIMEPGMSWMDSGEVGGPVRNVEVQPGGVWGEREAASASVMTVDEFGFTT